MMGLKTLLLLLLLLAILAVMLAAGSRGRSMPGAPMDISKKDFGVQQVALHATCSYNNQSNDAFLFKPSAILSAQRQHSVFPTIVQARPGQGDLQPDQKKINMPKIVKGLRYIVDLELSRTVCRKRDKNNNNLSNCDFQPEGHLHQTFQCHIEVWVIPWQNETTTQVFRCKS